MKQLHPELALERSESNSLTIRHIAEHGPNPIVLPLGGSIQSETKFGPSHSHRIWRMMNALIDAVPEWADAVAFEQAREKMLQHGLSKGMTLEELYALSDPDTILGLWTEAEARDAEV